jgi:hypothetical protein
MCFRCNPPLVVERSAPDDSKRAFEAGRRSRLSVKPCSAVHTNTALLRATVARGDAAEYQTRLVFTGHLKSISRNDDANRERAASRTLTVRTVAGVDEDWRPRDLVANGTTQTSTIQRHLHRTIPSAFPRRTIKGRNSAGQSEDPVISGSPRDKPEYRALIRGTLMRPVETFPGWAAPELWGSHRA